ncbi:hypothetical protein MGG_17631 [Pyricularia oryzae 70-15]|uniref:Uncharacterized protein n=1 Tax=Pyricularia oryzae (strain 70-15 / ATCC MYA-4617 / FGSC 8958) TaxID=242507 RepID=G4NGE3_PYRO7|nr:uncharacterized protein MGG_17631 [Pyricularia oryzae 70-15]EHA47100.1 hypothetical protein MGG_17631 [Pyricularia oryzae 70-15]
MNMPTSLQPGSEDADQTSPESKFATQSDGILYSRPLDGLPESVSYSAERHVCAPSLIGTFCSQSF